MRTFLAAVLSVIALGVMLVAYGLLSPRVSAADSYRSVQPAYATERISFGDPRVAETPRLQLRCEPGQRAIIRQVADAAAAECVDEGYAPARASLARPVGASETYVAPPSPPRATTRVVRASSRRDWTKTAMLIGGSSATGAGVGAIFGGGKGALIGAAIGGGARTLYEVKKR